MPVGEVTVSSGSDAMETPAANTRRPAAAITGAARPSLLAQYACHTSARASTCPAPKAEPIAPALFPRAPGPIFHVSPTSRGRAIPRIRLRSRPLVCEAALEREF